MKKIKKMNILLSCCMLIVPVFSVSASAKDNTLRASAICISDSMKLGSQIQSNKFKTNIKTVKANQYKKNKNNNFLIIDQNYYNSQEKDVKRKLSKDIKKEYNNKKKIIYYGNNKNLNIDKIYKELGLLRTYTTTHGNSNSNDNINMANTKNTSEANNSKSILDNDLVAIILEKSESGTPIDIYYYNDYIDRNKAVSNYKLLSNLLGSIGIQSFTNNHKKDLDDCSINTQNIRLDPYCKNSERNSIDVYDGDQMVAYFYYQIQRVYIDNHQTQWELKTTNYVQPRDGFFTDHVDQFVWSRDEERICKVTPTTDQHYQTYNFGIGYNGEDINVGFNYSFNQNDIDCRHNFIDNSPHNLTSHWWFEYNSGPFGHSSVQKNDSQNETGALISNYKGRLRITTQSFFEVDFNQTSRYIQFQRDNHRAFNIRDIYEKY